MFALTGHWEILLIVLALLLLFGGRKIPELARGLGTGIREFQQGMRGKKEDKPLPDAKAGDKEDPPERDS